MLKLLLGFLSGPLSSISNDLKEAYAARLKAETDEERLAQEERIKILEARKEVILKAQGDTYEKWVRILLALPFVVYINKLVLWDKVFGLGVTDPLGEDLTLVMMLVLGGYFVDTWIRRR